MRTFGPYILKGLSKVAGTLVSYRNELTCKLTVTGCILDGCPEQQASGKFITNTSKRLVSLCFALTWIRTPRVRARGIRGFQWAVVGEKRWGLIPECRKVWMSLNVGLEALDMESKASPEARFFALQPWRNPVLIFSAGREP